VRTYAVNKIQENKKYFDIYPDTRDQVYGGVDCESTFTNKIVEETKGQLLFFEDELAVIYYHSTCGGQTENIVNTFGNKSLTYLRSVEDGSEPYCKISPAFEWVESYTEKVFVERLFNAMLLDSKDFSIVSINVNSRFESNRINELEIVLKKNNQNEKTVLLKGNGIRNIIKNSAGNAILKSTMFDIKIDNNRNIIINGKGYGHGVGLCQWGAIGQSKKGKNYLEILEHYFHGTKVVKKYD
jgi:stage II sporulation protein D